MKKNNIAGPSSKRMLPLSFLFLILFCPFFTQAEDGINAKFTGAFTQGGLVIGKTNPNYLVTIDKRHVRISKHGQFILGFSRNAPPIQKVKISNDKGNYRIFKMKVEQRSYKVSRITGLPQKKVTPDSHDIARIKLDNSKILAVRRLDSPLNGFLSKFIWPVKGRISGVFGSIRILNNIRKNPHNGVDIAAPMGTPIIAPANGIVRLTDDNMFLAGKTIMIDHGHGLTSIFIHLEKILVKPNQIIKKRDVIGTIGMTGRATGPHLHWGLTLFEKHLDPKLVITKNKQ